uniref:Uncharacterized protein n=1 Tax=Arion vulgaris TaxID=1028688 RepID=A0A0B6Z3K3_9EUPU
MFVGSRKSLSLGLTLVEIIFEDSSEVGCLSIPLLIYNPVQIIIGSISVELLKMWLTGQKRRSR